MVLTIDTIARPLVNASDEAILDRGFTLTSAPQNCPPTAKQTARFYIPLATLKNDAASCFLHHLDVTKIAATPFFHP